VIALAAEIETSGTCPILGMTTVRATETFWPTTCPILGMTTVRATETFWPTKLKKIIKAGFLRLEPAIKLDFVHWKIF
jgi:hypothetical protein